MRRAMAILLALTPPDFREGWGEELLAVHGRRMREPRGGAARLAFALREVGGLAGVVARLRWKALSSPERGRRVPAEGPASGGADPWTGLLLAGGAALTVVGGGLGYGAGLRAGFALMLVALLLLALGLSVRARRSPALSRATTRLARLTAACALGLAVTVALSAAPAEPLSVWVAWLRYPSALGFMVGSAAFAARGILRGELPALPAAAVGAGGLLLALAALGVHGPGQPGQWLGVLGWIALAFSPWGRGGRVATSPEHA
ncbi:MAG TPA: hypothetical protein VKA44_03495 [Gemmatimonadota bacterium]|nr:hypothetical protein [Gemmatimonadota bacterium]